MATDTLHDRAQICSHGPKVCPENAVKLEQLYSEAFDHWNEQCTPRSSRIHTLMLKPRKHKVSSPNVYGILSAASRESAVEALEKGHTAGYIQESEALEENFDMNSADAMDSLEPEESPLPRTAEIHVLFSELEYKLICHIIDSTASSQWCRSHFHGLLTISSTFWRRCARIKCRWLRIEGLENLWYIVRQRIPVYPAIL